MDSNSNSRRSVNLCVFMKQLVSSDVGRLPNKDGNYEQLIEGLRVASCYLDEHGQPALVTPEEAANIRHSGRDTICFNSAMQLLGELEHEIRSLRVKETEDSPVEEIETPSIEEEQKASPPQKNPKNARRRRRKRKK